jgi:urease accessory protein
MSAAVFLSERSPFARGADPLARVRAEAVVEITAAAEGGGMSALATLHETGGYRVKFPDRQGDTLEAVLINTGGGVAGGDRIAVRAEAGPGSRLSLTTATAERIYRSLAAPTRIDVRLAAAAGATLAWLPQASVAFSGARLCRRIEVDMAADARLVVAETLVFGRRASGEVITGGDLRDQWRVRRAGRLLFAEAMRLDGAMSAALSRPAVAGKASVAALLLCVAPDAETRCGALCGALEGAPVEAGVSAWNGFVTVRMLAERLDHAAAAMRLAVAALAACPLPTAWTH